MLLSDYSFFLPEHLIAQEPLESRDGSRMLVVDKVAGSFSDQGFIELERFLVKGDLVVLNNTKVFPARLQGKVSSGANVEVFLVEEIEPCVWITLARPAKRLRSGKTIIFDEKLSGEVLERTNDGKVIIRFISAQRFDEVIARIGKTPLPPYIKRNGESIDRDRFRYQTVYASKEGAIAAPTAGLHFSHPFLERLSEMGVEFAEITLHVGYGTFEPVRESDLTLHSVAPERFEVNEPVAEMLERARVEKRRIIAVGTTTTRALEFLLHRYDSFGAAKGSADLTITPGYRFRAIDALLTNFHLSESSLLILVASFGGHELIMSAYRHAVSSGYRFYSYGDCMFIS